MLIFTQDGQLINMNDGELEITNANKKVMLIREDEPRIVLGSYNTFERRVAVFAELYAARNSGQGKFVMPQT